jgi:hypothetical protein
MNKEELERLKVSLQENIDDTNYWVENAPTDDDWHWHVGYRTALKEMLEILKTIGE